MGNKSNLQIESNLMIDDGNKKIIQYVPGYLIPELNGRDSRIINKLYLTKKQRYEYEMTIYCCDCGRPCAGTCKNIS